MCLSIPLTPEDERLLSERAVALGKDPASFALDVLRRELSRVAELELLLAPIHEEFEQTGMTDDELSNMLEDIKHDLRRFDSPRNT